MERRRFWIKRIGNYNRYYYLLNILCFKKAFRQIIIIKLNKIVNKTSTNIDNTVVEVLEGPLKFLPVVIGFFIATSYIELKPDLLSFIEKLNRTLITVFIFWLLHQLIVPFSFIIKKFDSIKHH